MVLSLIVSTGGRSLSTMVVMLDALPSFVKLVDAITKYLNCYCFGSFSWCEGQFTIGCGVVRTRSSCTIDRNIIYVTGLPEAVLRLTV